MKPHPSMGALDNEAFVRQALGLGTVLASWPLYTRKGQYPDTSTGLRALVELRVLEEIPKDPWGNEYVYMNEGGKPVLISYAADGTSGGEGPDADISSKDAQQIATR